LRDLRFDRAKVLASLLLALVLGLNLGLELVLFRKEWRRVLDELDASDQLALTLLRVGLLLQLPLDAADALLDSGGGVPFGVDLLGESVLLILQRLLALDRRVLGVEDLALLGLEFLDLGQLCADLLSVDGRSVRALLGGRLGGK
jgi:hypothetical protein